jgi:CubicO group peptidase (beta-lactamase class C family)
MAGAALGAEPTNETSQPPAFEWQLAAPESQGLSATRLLALQQSLAAKNTKALLIVRNDRIVYEWYAPGHAREKTQNTASLAKAVVGGMSLATAMNDGKLALDDKAARFISEWSQDARKREITLRQLGSHTAGLDDAEQNDLPHDRLTGWQGDFWKRLPPPNDPFTIARDRTPAIYPPGERLQYSNPGIALLTYAVTAALQESPRKDIRTLLRERVMRPIGVPDKAWSIGYGKTVEAAGLPLVASWGGGNYTARALARVGRLMLRGGNWEGVQLLSPEVVRQTTTDAGTPGHAAIGWWSNNSRRYPRLAPDAFWGAGAGHQILLVVPSEDLIVVRNGGALSAKGEYHDALGEFLFAPLLTALAPDAKTSQAPYPPSKLIERIEWAPVETIVRQARGGDNWPLTWADDDHQYAAYGDAQGFEPRLPKKLSLGLARIEGGPGDFHGINVRSSSFEQTGAGNRGKKASGMLMVDGILYAAVRNAGNSQLAWSKDRGQSWTWSDWKWSESFGCPTLLNFGRNYAGARDRYVYFYSPDRDSAYEAADRLVLARVPQDRIAELAAYEYYTGTDRAGSPTWSRAIGDRGAAFRHPGKCYRTSVTYDAGLKRYLLCQIVAGKSASGRDTRFEGGFGVYEAPEPWGPWSTVFYTERWDVGPGETNSFPSKWMSADGKSLHLVFSGDDCFSVRKATLVTRH